MLPLSSWMRDTFFTMLSCIRDCWFSFTCWISSRFRSSTDCTCRNPLLRVAHASGSPTSSASSPSDSPVVVLTVVVVVAGWWRWRRWCFLERRWLEGSSMVDSAAEEDEFICCAWNTKEDSTKFCWVTHCKLCEFRPLLGQCYIYATLQGQSCYYSRYSHQQWCFFYPWACILR